MPTYKLKYFDARGFGEVSRLLFALAGQEYEDIRFKREQWPEEKPKTPFGFAPVLEIDGKQYGQSGAIARYLARKFGCYGRDELEGLEIEQVLGIGQDITTLLLKMYSEKDETRKAEIMKENKEEKLPMYMRMFEKILKNNGGSGYFVGNEITLADLSVYDLLEKIEAFVTFDDYPLLKKSMEIVPSNPKLKAWLDKRPVTQF